MNLVQRFNALNGKEVSRKELESILLEAKKEQNADVFYRLSNLLNTDKTSSGFNIQIKKQASQLGAPVKKLFKEALTPTGRLRKGFVFKNGKITKAPTSSKKTRKGLNSPGSKKTIDLDFLAGLEYVQGDDKDLENGLNAPVSPDDIYKKITDTVIDAIEKTTITKGSKEWDDSFLEKGGYNTPVSFISKKPYRGVNVLLTKKGNPYHVFDNPYFLTFKQIKELKGTLIKGSKSVPVVYFTRLFKFENKAKKQSFGTYDKGKMATYLKSKGYNPSNFDFLVKTIPILKYFNVFNGSLTKGIDFGLDNLTDIEKVKLAYIAPSKGLEEPKNKTAELIVKNIPSDSAKIVQGENNLRAFYNSLSDKVTMPAFKSFKSANAYYRVLFHELTHSTGHAKRLNRTFGKKFGDKNYAKEELVAEFGAVFLSAQAGFMWRSEKSHAEYLKSWKSSIKHAKDDNKFLMRAASEAQKAADLLLSVDDNKEPKFFKELEKSLKKVSPEKKAAKKKVKKNKGQYELALAGRKSSNKPPRKYIKKKVNNNKLIKKGLGNPNLAVNSLASQREARKNKIAQYYDIQDDNISGFLGDIEIKEKQSIVITLSGGEGSGKTRSCFRFINAFAINYKVGHVSLEEHPESTLYWDKVDEYINPLNEVNIDTPEVKNLDELDRVIQENDIIVIDSFAKLKEMDRSVEIDTHLRTKYNGKLFIVIFQETSDGKMRGGSKSQYDGDIILHTEKNDDYTKSYVRASKNRYQDKILNTLKYNFYLGELIDENIIEVI